jgi:hypothetical protein
MAAILIGPSLLTLVVVMVNIWIFVPDLLFLGVLLFTLVLCSIALVSLLYISGVYHDHGLSSIHEYPLEMRRVETAIGLFLTSREARFDKEVGTWRLRTRMQVVYECHEMDDLRFVILVRPVRSPEEEATRVRLLHDIEEGASREELERAIDRAIANPLELGLKKYHREKEPELHMLDGKPLLTYEEVE